MQEPVANPAYSKDHPFPATVTENRLLSGPGSSKETRHLVVSLAGSGLSYKAGDSLGVYPGNRTSEVEAILKALGATGDEEVVLPRVEGGVPLREALLTRLSLGDPGRKLVETLAHRAANPAERETLVGLLLPESRERLTGWLEEREFIDLLEEFPSARLGPQELADHMRKLMPRLYSVASSSRLHPQEVHLTLAVVRYTTNGRDRVGVCSTFLADRALVGRTPVPVFVSPSHFGPPEDPARDAVMVGPGTGIAPFRAFLQEREALGAPGRNWLFFGDQTRANDFIYREDLERWQGTGLLTRLDTAFSRDQAAKVYVQDRMRENGAELWSWLQKGAYFFVCGDAKRMARDVDAALHEIVSLHGKMTPAQADDYVKLLKKERRYQRDVY